MNTTIIPVNETYQIELVPASGNYYPMLKTADGKRFCYFNKGRNKQESRKTLKGAQKFITEYQTRMGNAAELAEETAACNMEWKRLLTGGKS